MDFREIKRIVELMDQHGLSVFKLEQGETKLELKKGGDLDVKVVETLLDEVDSNGDGIINYDEFSASIMKAAN